VLVAALSAAPPRWQALWARHLRRPDCLWGGQKAAAKLKLLHPFRLPTDTPKGWLASASNCKQARCTALGSVCSLCTVRATDCLRQPVAPLPLLLPLTICQPSSSSLPAELSFSGLSLGRFSPFGLPKAQEARQPPTQRPQTASASASNSTTPTPTRPLWPPFHRWLGNAASPQGLYPSLLQSYWQDRLAGRPMASSPSDGKLAV